MTARRLPTSRHNYLALIDAECQRRGALVDVHEVTVKHDDWCDALAGRAFCNCSPEVTFAGDGSKSKCTTC